LSYVLSRFFVIPSLVYLGKQISCVRAGSQGRAYYK